MKLILLAAAVAALAVPAFAQTNVGVSVNVSQPGLYGRIDIGNVPTPPVLVYQQPVVITQTPVVVHQSPIYLHVPPGHEKHWGKHCAKYNACGQPVYFVREDWYQKHYVHVRDHGPDRDGDHQRHKHGKGKGNKHDDR